MTVSEGCAIFPSDILVKIVLVRKYLASVVVYRECDWLADLVFDRFVDAPCL